MKVLNVTDVNTALVKGIKYLTTSGFPQSSRAGQVLVAPGPVTTHYREPWNMVLFSKHRDANPFFHLMESMWLLAGRDDTPFLDYYVRDFGSRFAEPGGVLAGSYGHRWRHEFGYDQLAAIVKKLRSDPGTRQAVLQMWDARRSSSPTFMGANDLEGDWKDRPCNTQVYFRTRRGAIDMTVTCRSNDIIMGAYGANAVQFGMLQEYICGMVGAPMGEYWQVSNDYHAYMSDLERLTKRASTPQLDSASVADQAIFGAMLSGMMDDDRYRDRGVYGDPLVLDPASFDAELQKLMYYVDWTQTRMPEDMVVKTKFKNLFLVGTVLQAAIAYAQYKRRDFVAAYDTAARIQARDWRMACCEWLNRRIK